MVDQNRIFRLDQQTVGQTALTRFPGPLMMTAVSFDNILVLEMLGFGVVAPEIYHWISKRSMEKE